MSEFVIHGHADREKFQSPAPLIKGFLPDHGTGVLYAGWGSYKTFVALGAAFAVATGKPAFNALPVSRTGPVIYLCGEGYPDFIKSRLPAHFVAYRIPDPNKVPFGTVNRVPDVGFPDEAGDLIKLVRKTFTAPPALVVVDPFARTMASLDENTASDAAKYLEFSETVARELGCFVLTVAHSGKDEAKGVRGSDAFSAGVDVIWQSKRTAPERVQLVCHKNKSGAVPEPIKLMARPINGSLVFIADPA